MRYSFEQKNSGIEIKAEGFCITVGRDDFGNLSLTYYGSIPHKLRRLLEKYKHLFITPEMARTLICNEISTL